MKSHQTWGLNDQLASAESSVGGQDLQLTINSCSPASGARITVGRDAMSLFSVESSNPNERLADLYIRGDDLIAKYQSSDDQFDRELYWRVPDLDLPVGAFALEMIYSLQTDLLETNPNPRIISELKAREVEYWAADGDSLAGELKWKQQATADGCQMITAKLSDETRLAVAVYPNDLMVMEFAEIDGETILTCRLNAEFLEKGVIRRTRMFAMCAAGNVSDADMIKVAQEFLDSDLPLTT